MLRRLPLVRLLAALLACAIVSLLLLQLKLSALHVASELPQAETDPVPAPVPSPLSLDAGVRNPASPPQPSSVTLPKLYIYDLEEALGNASLPMLMQQLFGDAGHSEIRHGTALGPKCDYRLEACSLRQFMHELVLVEQLRSSPHVTSDAAAADLLLVPLPSTLTYMYLRGLGNRGCGEQIVDDNCGGGGGGGGGGDDDDADDVMRPSLLRSLLPPLSSKASTLFS